MFPIPKNNRTSLCDSSNHRAIALSNMFSKGLYWISLMKEQAYLSITQCTSLLGTIDYYNYNNSSVFLYKEELYSDKKILQKKYSVGIIDMIKLRNIYNTYTYMPIYIQLNTYTYM